jgi:hypothetical protein
MGKDRKMREISGTNVLVELPDKTLTALEDAIDIMDDGYVDPDVIMRKMHVCKKTLQNMICEKKITPDMYRVARNGLKTFDYIKVMDVMNKESRKWKRTA